MKQIIEKWGWIIIIVLSEILCGVLLQLIKVKFFDDNDNVVVVRQTINNNEFMLKKADYYLAVGQKFELQIDNPNNIKYELSMEYNDILDENNIALKPGKFSYIIKLNGFTAFSGRVYVVRGLVIKPELFNKQKPFISCNEFSDEENKIIDNALKDRMASVGNNTRAAAVEASRFITMEFDRRIPYFYENGRLNNHEGHHVDGEGRYYHKGLYLSKSKYKELEKSWTGPGSWGCRILQFEPAEHYGFIKNTRMPNGMDCSGLVSWILYNAGFDVKDTAAGDTPYRYDELYDLGEKVYLTYDLLDSGRIKTGDLIAYDGHMAFISGMSEDGTYYVTESLPNFRGVVLNKYSRAGLVATFSHVMLMDSVYKEDGKLTNMWY